LPGTLDQISEVLPDLSRQAHLRINAVRERCDALVAKAEVEYAKLIQQASMTDDTRRSRELRNQAREVRQAAQDKAAVRLLNAQAKLYLPLTGERFPYRKAIKAYQSDRLKEKAAPKTINEEVGFLLRLLGDQGDGIRARLRRQKALKLATGKQVGKAYTPEEKERLLAEAKAARSPVIYPALMLALNAGIRDAEIRTMQWERLDLSKAYLTVGDSKTEAGEGRTIPLNSELLEAMVEYSKWYTKRFGTIQPDWYVFAFGKPWPKDPTRPVVSLKTAWKNARRKAKVEGRWHDNRHTFITALAESGEAGDETTRDMAGHVSRQMLKHYSHIAMEAKRRAVESLVSKKSETVIRYTQNRSVRSGNARDAGRLRQRIHQSGAYQLRVWGFCCL
jgi:integrase